MPSATILNLLREGTIEEIDAVSDVIMERQRQDDKWGVQQHLPEVWLAILGEEYGELSEAVLRCRFPHLDDPKAGRTVRRDRIDDVRDEAIHTAAVALAMVESIDRGDWS